MENEEYKIQDFIPCGIGALIRDHRTQSVRLNSSRKVGIEKDIGNWSYAGYHATTLILGGASVLYIGIKGLEYLIN